MLDNIYESLCLVKIHKVPRKYVYDEISNVFIIVESRVQIAKIFYRKLLSKSMPQGNSNQETEKNPISLGAYLQFWKVFINQESKEEIRICITLYNQHLSK